LIPFVLRASGGWVRLVKVTYKLFEDGKFFSKSACNDAVSRCVGGNAKSPSFTLKGDDGA